MKLSLVGPSRRLARWPVGLSMVALGFLVPLIAAAAPNVRVGNRVTALRAQPPTYAQCMAAFGIACYGPQLIRTAYGLNSLIDAGYTGAGQTIVLVESYGSPTLMADLAQFDSDFGLPAPPSITVLAPIGAIPAFDPTVPDMISWAFETSLDVQWSHALAPGADIVVLVSPVDETEGVQGMPQFLALEKYALDNHLGKIISQSWGATENTLFTPGGQSVFATFDAFYERAAAEGVTVLASTGDYGSTAPELDGVTLYPMPVVGFPASSPWVTAIGGTALYTDASGNYQSETVWNDNALGAGAGSGGISQKFPSPFYQLFSLSSSVRASLGGHRGIPDLSFNADDVNSPVLVYTSFLGAGETGYFFIGGTSEGSPAWAGIIADLNEYAGHSLGFINPFLYALGGHGQFPEIGHDITIGNNSYAGVPGYSATSGWDLASGWGTPNLSLLPLNWQQLISAH